MTCTNALAEYVCLGYPVYYIWTHIGHKKIGHLHVLTSNVLVNDFDMWIAAHTDHKNIWCIHALPFYVFEEHKGKQLRELGAHM